MARTPPRCQLDARHTRPHADPNPAAAAAVPLAA
jgi:hypothetical protein